MVDAAGSDVVIQSIDDDSMDQPSSGLFQQADEDTIPEIQRTIQNLKTMNRRLGFGIPKKSPDLSDQGSGGSSPLSHPDEDMSIIEGLLDMTPPFGRQTCQVVIRPRPKLRALPYSSMQSGLVYDARMRFHCEVVTGKTDSTDFHPEDPQRIYAIFTELKDAGLVPDDLEDPSPEDEFKLWRIAARDAKRAEICLVHSREHYEFVKSLRLKSDEPLVELAASMDSIYMNQSTFMAAKLSTGGAIEACDAVVAGRVKNSIAVIRPPGHHAERDKPCGFCFFDNVAVAAKVMQRDHPDKCRKILILDWDVHHGNGIQQAFYDDPNVLYISIHVHNNGQFYPMGPCGGSNQCGEGAGLGLNVNIPWGQHHMTDGDYIYAFQKVVMPIAQQFDPDFVIVAAGFDAADGDDLGHCHVSPAGYAHMTHMLMSLANGKVAVCLEGGYNLRSIAKSSLAVTRTLMGEPPGRILDCKVSDEGADDVHSVMRQQSKHWRCMYPKDHGQILKNRLGDVPNAVERMDDVVRKHQVHSLWVKHKMRSLPIIREKLSKPYENQVLVTNNFDQPGVPLLVILHDPPEVLATPNLRTGDVELHNTWLADVSKTYVDGAVDLGIAVMDVNITRHSKPLDSNETGEYSASEEKLARSKSTRELCSYLWDNYIYPNETKHLFFIGIGDAYMGLIHLLKIHNEELIDNTDFVYTFVSGNTLSSVRRHTDDASSVRWFYERSRVFVSEDHAYWHPSREQTARPSKKYGNIIKSPRATLNEMLALHRDEILAHLRDQVSPWLEEQKTQPKPVKPAAHAAPFITKSAASSSTLFSAAAHNGTANGLGVKPSLFTTYADADGDVVMHDAHGNDSARHAPASRNAPTSTPMPDSAMSPSTKNNNSLPPPLGSFPSPNAKAVKKSARTPGAKAPLKSPAMRLPRLGKFASPPGR